MTDRRKRQRDILRAKRLNPEYLAAENANNAARMAAKRVKWVAAGRCRDCGKPPKGFVYCTGCRKANVRRMVRKRAAKRRKGEEE